jgi:prolipoprotein diacylglyceryltransferase
MEYSENTSDMSSITDKLYVDVHPSVLYNSVVLFHVSFILSVILSFMTSGYPFDIFKLFLDFI